MSLPLPVHLYPAPEPVGYVRAVDLPLQQRLALLMMRRGELAEKVLAACKQALVHPPRLHHFRALVGSGYATRCGQYHRLTPLGSLAANIVAEALAKQLGIHHFIPGGSRFYLTLRCVCGNFQASHSRNEGHWEAAEMRLRSKHIAQIEAADAMRTPIAPALVLDALQPAEGP